MKGLTARQQDLLDFIEAFTETMHMAPTIYEIAAHFAIKPSTVFAHLNALHKKKVLTRSGKARSIMIADTHRRRIRQIDILSRSIAVKGSNRYKNLRFDLRFFSHVQDSSEVFALNLQENALPDSGILQGDLILLQKVPVSAIHPGNLLLVEDNGTPILCRCLTCSNEKVEMLAQGGRRICTTPAGITLMGSVIGLQRNY